MKREFLTEKLFIEKGSKFHNNKFDYSLISNFNSNNKITIICPIHDKFEQKPHHHLTGYGCPECFKLSQIKTNETFISEIKKIFPNLTIVGEYKNNYTKLIVKDENNIKYLTTPNSLLSGKYPNMKTCLNKNDLFKNKAMLKHGNTYDYNNVDYVNTETKINITCKVHGDFLQLPSNHLNGQGCPYCKKEFTVYSRTSWITHCNNRNLKPFIYIIECYNDFESFIKIGLTSRTINERFHNKIEMPYNYKIIKKIFGEPGFIFDKEIELHRLFKEFKYQPNIKFSGNYECYTTNILEFMSF